MNITTRLRVTTAAGFISFCVGVWLWLKADSFSTVRLPAGLVQIGERLHALVAVASAFLWLGVALLALSAAAWLFFTPASSPHVSLTAESAA